MPALDFEGYFKRLSNTELLQILREPGKYQSEALASARKELDSRQLSDGAVATANEILAVNDEKLVAKKDKARQRDEQLKKASNFLEESIIAGRGANRSLNTTINGFVIGYSFIILLQAVAESRWLWYNIKHLYQTPVTSLMQLLPYLFAVPMLFLFAKRKKAGWYLFAAYLEFYTLYTAAGFYYFIRVEIEAFSGGYLRAMPSPAAIILLAIIYPASLYMICRQGVVEAFGVDIKKKNETLIGLAIVFALLIVAVGIIY